MSVFQPKKEQWKETLQLAIFDCNLTDIHDIIRTRQQVCDRNNEQFSLDFNFEYFTPLCLAIFFGNTEVVRVLLEAGAGTMFKSMYTTGPLQVTFGRLEQSAFKLAAKCDRSVCLDILIDHAVATGITIPSEEVFESVKMYNELDCVKLMLRKGFVPSLTVGGNIFDHSARRQLTQMMNMTMAQSPMLPQLGKIKLQDMLQKHQMSFPQEYLELLTKLMMYCPSLQSQCKARILTAVGELYMEKVSLLPLPEPLIGYLQSLESNFNIMS